MKKFLALIMAIAILFTFCACRKGSASLSSNGSVPMSTKGFVKPQNYAAVLLFRVNPSFEIYIDDNLKVLAINAVNSDAESIVDSIDLSDKSLESVIGNILKTAHNSGFLKENAAIEIKYLETLSDALDAANALAKSENAARDSANELGVPVTVNAPANDETASSSSQSFSSSQVSSQTQNSSKNESSSAPATSSETETASKEESSSKDESAGNKPTAVVVVNPKEKLDKSGEYVSSVIKREDDTCLFAGGISFDSEYAILLSATFAPEGYDPDMSTNRPALDFEGRKYYRIGAGQTPHNLEITDTEIIIKNTPYTEEETVCAKMVLLSDGTLKVTFVDDENRWRFEVGEILSTEYNYLS